MGDMAKAYEPQAVEDALYKKWEEAGFFTPENLPGDRKETFSIVLPPPNVTGTLHMGHATMLAIEDAMIRFARLSGKKALWVPGTDHAAIATQSKVEKTIFESEGKSRHDLGREAFLQRVNNFAQKSHDTIVSQSKKMGASLDWSREAYTLDDARNKAVNAAFKKMYDDGLIYRGDRAVNWDPAMQTTVSDDEIEWREERAPFYYLQYGPFVIGTSRPETKFGDKYVVMHPNDKRYAEYKEGQKLEIEWILGKTMATVIKDEAVDPEFGSGVMTITPWHDMVDFDIAERRGLDKEQVIDFNGKMLPLAGDFAGLTIAEARKKVVERLQEKGLLVRIEENYTHRVATNSRGGGIIEPQIKRQWFVDVNKKFRRGLKRVTLKSLMQDAVRSGNVEILPERFVKTYFHWIDNLRDWNISRQIWFGHRVPVWYRGEEMVVGEAPNGEGWEQDPDTLDTWFSSGLWTFSTLGWPNNTEDLKLYHPTSVLETGYDILFFWVARMILMSTYLLGEVPFKTVYLHGLVRDDQGRKMSKSLGNIIDPVDMINKYGADATRLSLLIGSTPGNDMKLSEEKIAGFRNFTNKLWNIARFIEMTTKGLRHVDSVEPKTLADRWILCRLAEVTEKVTKYHESYQLSLAGELLCDFTWSDFADWYLEIAKVEKDKDDILCFVLERLLILWHPFMPFVTEEIYTKFNRGMLIVAEWPTGEARDKRQEASGEFGKIQEIVTAIRNIRAEYKVPPKNLVNVVMTGADDIGAYTEVIGALSRSTISEGEKPQNAASTIAGGVHIHVSLEGLVDVEKERTRLSTELVEVSKYVQMQSTKLDNADFVKRAPENVIALERQKLADAKAKEEKLKTELAALK